MAAMKLKKSLSREKSLINGLRMLWFRHLHNLLSPGDDMIMPTGGSLYCSGNKK